METTQMSLHSSLEIKDNMCCPDVSQNQNTSDTNNNKLDITKNSLSVGELSDEEEFQDATKFFQNEPELEHLENIRTSNQNSWLNRNSLGKNFDPLFKTYGQQLDLTCVVESENECTLSPAPLPDVDKTASVNIEETAINLVDGKLSFVEGQILTPTRESIHLIKFDSPEKKRSSDYFESLKTSLTCPVLHRKEDLDKLLKLQELQFEEAHLRKQRDLELERKKILNEKDNETALLKGIISAFCLTMRNLEMVFHNLHEQKERFTNQLQNLQVSIRDKTEDLESASQSLNNAKQRTLSFKQCSDLTEELLKICKSNEEFYSTEVKILQRKLLVLDEQYKSLQIVFTKLTEANVEDPKSTLDAQLKVLQALIEKSNLEEEYLDEQLKLAKDKHFQLNNFAKDLN